jgi:small secreted domain DUF320
MRSWMKNVGLVALVSAGLFAVGSGSASADSTDGRGGVLSGNQVRTPVSLPTNVSGNATAVAGRAAAIGSAQDPQAGNPGDMTTRTTSGAGGVLSGNQVDSPISAPVNACGNALAVKGDAKAACAGAMPTTSRMYGTDPNLSGAPTSIAAPGTREPGSTGTLTKLVPAAAGSIAPNAAPGSSQDLVVLERLTAARQTVGSIATR